MLGTGKKTLVLVRGEMTRSILVRVHLYFTAGWYVQFYCFRERGSEVSDRLRAKYPRRFQSVYLGAFIKKLLKGALSAASSGDRTLGAPLPARCLAAETGDQRFVLMSIDDMAGTLHASDKMYVKVPGAKSARDLGINWKALTMLVRRDDPAHMKHQVAMYAESSMRLAYTFLANGWTLSKQTTETSLAAKSELVKRWIATTPPTTPPTTPKTLVLVAVNESLTFALNDHILRGLLTKMWRIEIYLWRESVTNELLNLFHAHRKQVLLKPLDDNLNDFVYLDIQERSASNGPSSCNSSSGTSVGRFSVLQQLLDQVQGAELAKRDTKRDGQQSFLENQLNQQKADFERQLHEQRAEFLADYEHLKECLQNEFTYRLREMDAKRKSVFRNYKNYVEFMQQNTEETAPSE